MDLAKRLMSKLGKSEKSDEEPEGDAFKGFYDAMKADDQSGADEALKEVIYECLESMDDDDDDEPKGGLVIAMSPKRKGKGY